MDSELPISEVIPEIKSSLAGSNTLLLQAPPGAGKSTVLPLALMEAPWLAGQKILMLEPRRLAARAVAARLADNLGVTLGQEIGYRVRFESRTSSSTRLEVLTEGILTRLIQQDNALEGIGLVIFDEFHERSLQADLALVLCRQIQQILRPDLRILIMSATLATASLAAQLGEVPVISSQGRQFPIEHIYAPSPPGTRLEQHVARTVRRALAEQEGDLLVFLPGTAEIRRAYELLSEIPAAVHPLYGDLSPAEQDAAIRPHPEGRRKVVLATSIAETSLTIEGITTVIDSGLARVPRFDPRSGLTRLATVEVTQDAAAQRAGRAGRLGPGVCYRLWEARKHPHLLPFREPEILQADLAPLLLELAQWGSPVEDFDWPSPPPASALTQARELLTLLGALDAAGQITPGGKQMLRLPTHPRLAHMMLQDHPGLAGDITAILEERDPLPREVGADLRLRLDAIRRYRMKLPVDAEKSVLKRIIRLSDHWHRHTRAEQATPNDPYAAGRLLAAAYPERIARLVDPANARYRLSNRRMASLQQQDALANEEWIAIGHMDAGTQEGRIFLAAPLKPEDLPDRLSEHDVLQWDLRNGCLLSRTETRVGGLIWKTTDNRQPDPEAVVRELCHALRAKPGMLDWKSVEPWRHRVMSLRIWRPELELPDLSEEAILAQAESWLGPYLLPVRKADDFAKVDLKSALKALLPWALSQELDRFCPEKIKVPSGSEIRLEYFPDGKAPILAVRLQEMFGQLDTPTVNGGRQQVLIHLLSPANRPIQVTQDLRHFWQHTYADVRKDMRGRYSKHYWPEDPFSAEAIRGVKPRKDKS